MLQTIKRAHPYWVICGLVAVVVGLFTSKVVLSLGMISLLASALLNPAIKSDFTFFLKSKFLLFVPLVFLVVFIGFVYSENLVYWSYKVRLKLPFLILPFALIPLRHLRTSTRHWIIRLFILLATLLAASTLVNYAIHFDTITEGIKRGKSVPIPFGFHIDHVRFSIAAVMAVCFSVYLLRHNASNNSKLSKIALWTCIAILTVYSHCSAVRTGVVLYYLLLLSYIGYLIYRDKKWKLAILLLVVFGALLFGALQFSTPLKTKLGYMRYSISRFEKGNYHALDSDATRLASMTIALEVFKQHPILGTGVGDVRDVLNEIYASRENAVAENFLIHNQYLFVLAGMGLIGFLASFWVLIFPLITFLKHKQWPILAITLLFCAALLTDIQWEVQYGVALYGFWICFFYVDYYSRISNSTR